MVGPFHNTAPQLFSALFVLVWVLQTDLWNTGRISGRMEELVYPTCPRCSDRTGRSLQFSSTSDVFRGGTYDERFRSALAMHSHNQITQYCKLNCLHLFDIFKVRKYAQERIAPLVSKMDEESNMDDEVIKSLFEQGVC